VITSLIIEGYHCEGIENLLKMFKSQKLLKANLNSNTEKNDKCYKYLIEENKVDIINLLLIYGLNLDKLLEYSNKEIFNFDKTYINKLLLECLSKGKLDYVEKLLSNYADRNYIDDNGFTALHYACQKNYTTIIPMLITEKNVNLKNKDNYSPFMMALKEKYHDCALAILTSNYYINIDFQDDTSDEINSFLLYLINNNIKTDLIMKVLKQNDVNNHLTVLERKTLLKILLKLIENQKYEDIKYFIDNCKDIIYEKLDNNKSILMYAAQYCIEKHEILDLLIGYNDNRNSIDDYGFTALHYACKFNNVMAISKLATKENVNLKCKNNETPVLIACNEKNFNCAISLLFVENIDINISDTNKNDFIASMIKNKIENEKIFKWLLEEGAIISWRFFKSNIDKIVGNESFLQSIKTNGFLISNISKSIKIKNIKYPVIFSIQYKFINLLEKLIECYDTVNEMDEDGKPCIFYAIENNDEKYFNALINSNKVCIEEKDNSGKTALDYAMELRKENISKLLLHKYVDIYETNLDNNEFLKKIINSKFSIIYKELIKHKPISYSDINNIIVQLDNNKNNNSHDNSVINEINEKSTVTNNTDEEIKRIDNTDEVNNKRIDNTDEVNNKHIDNTEEKIKHIDENNDIDVNNIFIEDTENVKPKNINIDNTDEEIKHIDNIDEEIKHIDNTDEEIKQIDNTDEVNNKHIDNTDEEIKQIDNTDEEIKQIDNTDEVNNKHIDNTEEEIKHIDENNDIDVNNVFIEDTENVKSKNINIDNTDEEIKQIDNTDEEIKQIDNTDEEIKQIDNTDEEIKQIDNTDEEIKQIDDTDQEAKHIDENNDIDVNNVFIEDTENDKTKNINIDNTEEEIKNIDNTDEEVKHIDENNNIVNNMDIIEDIESDSENNIIVKDNENNENNIIFNEYIDNNTEYYTANNIEANDKSISIIADEVKSIEDSIITEEIEYIESTISYEDESTEINNKENSENNKKEINSIEEENNESIYNYNGIVIGEENADINIEKAFSKENYEIEKVNASSSSDEYSILEMACIIGNKIIIEPLIKTYLFDINKQLGEYHQTPLMLLISNENYSSVDLLLKYNSDVNVTDIYGNTPFTYMLKHFKVNEEIYESLINNGAYINYELFKNNEFLNMVMKNDIFIKLYINKRIKVKYENDNRILVITEPLTFAVKLNNYNFVKTLCERKISVDELFKVKNNPIKISSKNDNKEIFQLLSEYKINETINNNKAYSNDDNMYNENIIKIDDDDNVNIEEEIIFSDGDNVNIEEIINSDDNYDTSDDSSISFIIKGKESISTENTVTNQYEDLIFEDNPEINNQDYISEENSNETNKISSYDYDYNNILIENEIISNDDNNDDNNNDNNDNNNMIIEISSDDDYDLSDDSSISFIIKRKKSIFTKNTVTNQYKELINEDNLEINEYIDYNSEESDDETSDIMTDFDEDYDHKLFENDEDNCMYPELHYSCIVSNPEIIEFIVENYEDDINIQYGEYKFTPLMILIYLEKYDCAQVLLEKSSNLDVNVIDIYENTPLIYMIKYGKLMKIFMNY